VTAVAAIQNLCRDACLVVGERFEFDAAAQSAEFGALHVADEDLFEEVLRHGRTSVGPIFLLG
jgi:hypothetical protein